MMLGSDRKSQLPSAIESRVSTIHTLTTILYPDNRSVLHIQHSNNLHEIFDSI